MPGNEIWSITRSLHVPLNLRQTVLTLRITAGVSKKNVTAPHRSRPVSTMMVKCSFHQTVSAEPSAVNKSHRMTCERAVVNNARNCVTYRLVGRLSIKFFMVRVFVVVQRLDGCSQFGAAERMANGTLGTLSVGPRVSVAGSPSCSAA